MFRSAFLSKLSFAVALSVATVAAAVLVQGVLVFPDQFSKAWAPPRTIARQFSLGCNDRVALVLCTIHPRSQPGDPRNVIAVGDLSLHPPGFQILEFWDAPWNVVSASASQRGFLSTESGTLYSLDLAKPADSLTYLGRHGNGYLRLLECTDDGSVVIAASEHVTAWDRAAAKQLWRRKDIRLMSCAFVPGSRRLICGLENGDLVELDATTGTNSRQIAQRPAHHDSIVCLAVSRDGERVATIDSLGNCAVRDLATGGQVWSHRSWMPGGLQFSPDGQALVVPHFDRGVNMALVSLPSGAVATRLCGLEGMILNVTVTADGTAYVWNNQGTVIAWNLATGSITGQFTPNVFGPPASGSSSSLGNTASVLGASSPTRPGSFAKRKTAP